MKERKAPITHMYKVVSKTNTMHQVTNIETGKVVSERMRWSEADSDRKVANKAYLAGWLDGGADTCDSISDQFDALCVRLRLVAVDSEVA